MGLVRTTPPKILPVTLSRIKEQLNLSLDDKSRDGKLLALATAASNLCEQVTGRAWITQTWRLAIDWRFPLSSRGILLPRPPVQSVTSIQYVDDDGVTQTLAAAKYRLAKDHHPATITEAWNETWPTTRRVTEAVLVTYVAGYGDAPADVPEEAQLAVLLAVEAWFDMPLAGDLLLPRPALLLLKSLKVGTYAPSYPV